MSVYEVAPGATVDIPLVVFDGNGLLVAVTDARYQLRNSARTIVRAFPGSGTDFTQLATGVYVAAVIAPATVDSYSVEMEATVGGVLLQGEPDVLQVVAVASSSSVKQLVTG